MLDPPLNLAYAPGDRIAMSRGGPTVLRSTHDLAFKPDNSHASNGF